MNDARGLSSEELEILAIREIRKSGVAVHDPRVTRRVRLEHEDGTIAGFALELMAELHSAAQAGSEAGGSRTLILCRSEPEPVEAETIDRARAAAVHAQAVHAVMVSVSGYSPEAVRLARDTGVALLVVADGHEAFARSGWAGGGPAPTWLPRFIAEVVWLDRAGLEMRQPLSADNPRLLLDRLAVLRPPDDGAVTT